jgi:hypothetical protein
MKHDKLRRCVSLYLDDQIAPEEKPAVENHLRGCQSCSCYFKQITLLRQNFADLNRAKINPFFAQRVLAELDSRRPERFWALFDWVPRRLVLAGFTASVGFVCLLMLSSVPTTNQSSSALTQLYAEQTYSPLETDDQALAFAIQSDSQNSFGE